VDIRLMKYGLGLAALIVVLVLTGGSLLKVNGEPPVESATRTSSGPVALALQDTATPENGAESNGEATPAETSAPALEVSNVVPEADGQACPTTPLSASVVLNGWSFSAFTLDGADILGDTQISDDGTISYNPPTLLSGGVHEAMVAVADADGNTQSYTWSFEITGVGCSTAPTGTPPSDTPTPPTPPAPTAAPSGPPPGSPPPSGQPPAPPTGAPTGPALGALPSQGILHIVADHSWLSPQGDTQRTAPTETWLNLANGDARVNEKDPANGNEVSSSIRKGDSITRLVDQEKRATIQIFPDTQAPQLNEARDTLFGYRGAYEQGRLQFMGEETIDGVPAFHLSAPGQGDAGGLEVWLSKDYGLVLREIAYRPGSGGNREVAQTHVVTYRQVEVVPSIPDSIFNPTIASDWFKTTSQILTPQMAAGFRSFDIQWLGAEYQGNILVEMSQQTITGTPPGAPPGAPTGPQSFVVVAYAPAPPANAQAAQSATPPGPGITIFERQSTGGTPAGQIPPGGPNSPPGPGGSGGPGGPQGAPQGEQVTVNGNRGTIITLPPAPTPTTAQGGQQAGPPPTPPTILDITIGNTQVTIQGKDRAAVLQAAQDLKKVTP
jgi:hypothetical protein